MKSWIEGNRVCRTLLLAMLLAFVLTACTGVADGPGDPSPGVRSVDIEIVGRDGSTLLEDTMHTEAETLGDLLDEEGLIEYERTGLGRFITEMAGQRADPATEYWSIWVNDAYGQHGADSQPVRDGDTFTFTLVTY